MIGRRGFPIFVPKRYTLSIADLQVGIAAKIIGFSDEHWETQLMELGFLIGKTTQVMFAAPFKGPLAVEIGETLLSMRRDEAKAVLVEILSER